MLHEFAVFGQALLGASVRAVALDRDEFEVGKAIHDFAEFAVEGNLAVVNDDDAFA